MAWPELARHDGAEQPQRLILLAHGAGAGMDHPFMAAMASALADDQTQVVRFEFDYMVQARALDKRRPPDRLPKLVECFQRWAEAAKIAHPQAQLVLAGKSMGSRAAALVAQQVDAQAVLAFGYPFHPVGKTEPERWRWQPLQQCPVPLLICQGSRDNFGSQAELAAHTLPETVGLHWLDSGDHSLVPTKRSGFTQQQLIEQAAGACQTFLNRE
ncbi:alpha/beta family hydrolase [Ferrimonas marina]|uniref:KANL3/Tex30 alpha/beta hydrolase-like domain-containing protein n=1 Tax=Ferrimonas marina TaxID=299255 RepID=A0A1M5SC13_9GAMM|nr:alpha/beta family hydrolase [Ferrimonas marina]SHH35990.1 hypothetical protein SAMN02745129_1946 [Ferrimonas marina]